MSGTRTIVKLNLRNGWTVSIAPDTPPAQANVMAWPTRQDNQPWECLRFYVWKGDEGKIDIRLWSIADLFDRIAEIGSAEPPPL